MRPLEIIPDRSVVCGKLFLDFAQHAVVTETGYGEYVTVVEMDVLMGLGAYGFGRVARSEEIMQLVMARREARVTSGQREVYFTDRNLRTVMCGIRRKLEDPPERAYYIRTWPGVGFALTE